jgi:hypothetical protein
MSLEDKLNYLLQTKEMIKNAIIAKGVQILESDTFRSYAQKILDISSGGETGFKDSISIIENSIITADDSYFESITDDARIELAN